MAEALWLSQMATTRGRAKQRKAEFLKYRMVQDSLGSDQSHAGQEVPRIQSSITYHVSCIMCQELEGFK